MAATAFKMFGSMAVKSCGKAATRVSPAVVVNVALDFVEAGISVFNYFQENHRTQVLKKFLRKDKIRIDKTVDERWKQVRIEIDVEEKRVYERLSILRRELRTQLDILKMEQNKRENQLSMILKQQRKSEQISDQVRQSCMEVIGYLHPLVDGLRKHKISSDEIEQLFSTYEKAIRTYGKTLSV